ncbi:helix-turn-helix domain-containing protein [Pseudonocardia sp. MH-G8]|uniref:helix-turn-helix domain-containing protein n=1 Tax=Pseudonocardia sp. MH-G8 TaxID=1854588 RepID=UPI000BA0E4D4|nr:helix-turn-helix transcriptional regulator [Pseudonocardia sp. MH-G8]OZM80873.1 transcriptional regulator [Pseudonocardia sp. MH-G8]
MTGDNALGEFLRARRGLVLPGGALAPVDRRRRVSGLRREEIALLAGVSVDYYVRLEQGRERHPSAQVVEALARALELDDDAATHLHELARPRVRRRRQARRRERVSTHLAQMMAGWHRTPALILDRHLTVLAANDLGRALLAGHTHSDDLVRLIFLDPDARSFYPEWERAAANTVAGLRAAVGLDRDDPALIELVGELSVKSEPFRRLWARHDVRQKSHEVKRFHHPVVGELTLTYEALTVNSAPGQQLVVYHAEPGSPSEQALALLGSLAATDQDAPSRPTSTTKT